MSGGMPIRRIAALTGGALVPSARFRVRQYIPKLLENGVYVREFCARYGSYPPTIRWLRPFWACATLAQRLPSVVGTYSFDAVLLQREVVSTLLTLEPFTKKPRIFDVDDAVFLYGDGKAARRVAEISDHIICGNAFLAEWFASVNGNVTIIPTAVDTDRYVPAIQSPGTDGQRVIGWIGTSGNLKYLYAQEAALSRVLRECPEARLRVVCDQAPEFRTVDSCRVEFIRWTEEGELAAIQGMNIGIMPLEDSLWARGKCSFKMLQYMACGLPVVVSPVGMNMEILALGQVGIGASTVSQWAEALITLVRNDDLCGVFGVRARELAERQFSLAVVTPQLAHVFKEL